MIVDNVSELKSNSWKIYFGGCWIFIGLTIQLCIASFQSIERIFDDSAEILYKFYFGSYIQKVRFFLKMVSTQNTITVGVGDLKITKSPNLLKTLLGSCIGIVLYDSVNKVGGLLHIMLPKSNNDDKKITKYADPGLTYFIQQIIKNGGAFRGSLYAKIFGGAKMFETKGGLMNIGEANETAVRNILKGEGIKIVASKTGGTKGYNIVLDTETGKVSCRIFGEAITEH